MICNVTIPQIQTLNITGNIYAVCIMHLGILFNQITTSQKQFKKNAINCQSIFSFTFNVCIFRLIQIYYPTLITVEGFYLHHCIHQILIRIKKFLFPGFHIFIYLILFLILLTPNMFLLQNILSCLLAKFYLTTLI